MERWIAEKGMGAKVDERVQKPDTGRGKEELSTGVSWANKGFLNRQAKATLKITGKSKPTPGTTKHDTGTPSSDPIRTTNDPGYLPPAPGKSSHDPGHGKPDSRRAKTDEERPQCGETDFNSGESMWSLLERDESFFSRATRRFWNSESTQRLSQAPDIDAFEEPWQTRFSSATPHSARAARPREDNEDEDDLFAGIPTDDLDDYPYLRPRTTTTGVKGQDGDPLQYDQVTAQDIAISPEEQREISRDSLQQKYALRPYFGGSLSSAKQRKITPASQSATSPPAQLQPPNPVSIVADVSTLYITDLPQRVAPSLSSIQPHRGPQFNPLSTYPEDGNPPLNTNPDTAHVPDITPEGIQLLSDNGPDASKFDPLRTYLEDAKDKLEGCRNNVTDAGSHPTTAPAPAPSQ